jgi:hypothetical protein
MNIGFDLRLHGRCDMGGNRPIYVMLPLPGVEITVQETSVMTEEIVADPIAVEQPTQDEW